MSTSIAVAPPAVPAPVVLPEASEPELVAPKNSPRVEAAPAVAAVEQPEPATTVPVSAAAEEKAASEPAALPVAEVAAGDAEPAAPAHKPWFDGYYTGWGQSRHGDIQAYVTIKEGRIVDAGIATCETRYPCSVIDDIILQPINLQGPDVDRVSRATESADAYYTGLVRALEGAETGTFRSPRP